MEIEPYMYDCDAPPIHRDTIDSISYEEQGARSKEQGTKTKDKGQSTKNKD
jgi:hypothetical protein